MEAACLEGAASIINPAAPAGTISVLPDLNIDSIVNIVYLLWAFLLLHL